MKSNSENKNDLEFIKLKDYKVFDYEIPEISLNFIIENERVIVKTELQLLKRNKGNNNLVLKGIDIIIKKIYIDELLLKKESYSKLEKYLIIRSICQEKFSLRIEGIIKPKMNSSLLGMYESNGIITTQCEAEGFRRITYHPDRPDILSKNTK